MAYDTGLVFNTIYVIESLRPGDLRTGTELYDAVIRPATYDPEGAFAELHIVRDRVELHRVLAMILDDVQRYGRLPIIHLEAHGSDEGIGLGDGTHVPWNEITPILTAINKACRMNLLVVAMMCHGWQLTMALMPSERAPLFALIGPPETMDAGAIQDATRAFYSILLKNLQVNDALAAMNAGKPFEEWEIRPATAEILFCRVFRYYLQDLATELDLSARENKIVADIVRAQRLDLLQSSALRQAVRAKLNDHQWWYDYLRHTFLMLDLFPENKTRFGLSYDRCINTDGAGND